MSKEKLIKAPFGNESETASVGGLTIENRVDRVTVYGDIDITLDKEGLANAESLKALLDDIVEKMKAQDLPDKIVFDAPDDVSNPFA